MMPINKRKHLAIGNYFDFFFVRRRIYLGTFVRVQIFLFDDYFYLDMFYFFQDNLIQIK